MISSSPRRVVITGIGLISPLGNSKEQLWESLDTGKSGVGPLHNVPPDFFPFSFAAEVLDFTGNINDFGPITKEQKKAILVAFDAFMQAAFNAAKDLRVDESSDHASEVGGWADCYVKMADIIDNPPAGEPLIKYN